MAYIMNSASKDKYVLHCLALVDMDNAGQSLDHLDHINDEYLRCVLFRDAVICYAKPFSDNKGLQIKNLKISERAIPRELKSAHREIIGLRNKLFAHMDLDKQKPKIDPYELNGEKHVSVNVVGYSKIYPEHLIDPLKQLSQAVKRYIVNELFALQSHFNN
jgi:hypothetical protein